MIKRVIVVAVALASVLTAIGPVAQADLIAGVCTFDLTIKFSSTPTLKGPAVGYTISDSNSSCDVPLFGSTTTTIGASAGAGNGGLSLSRCGVLAGSGSWDQSWNDFLTPVVGGSQVLAGTWLQATIVSSSYPGTGGVTKLASVTELVPEPSAPTANATAAASCALGGAVSSIEFLGIQTFEDPN